jgi:hypothetical protein
MMMGAAERVKLIKLWVLGIRSGEKESKYWWQEETGGG